jgi:integrase/recombinase XerD
MAQLNQYLEFLPEPVMRMVLVIQETGLRVSELLQLPINCLRQDTNGDWFIRHLQNTIISKI